MKWYEIFDDDENSIWEAFSPYHDGHGIVVNWRLKQRLVNNCIEWYAAHDSELGGDCDGITWLSLAEAKEAVESADRSITLSET